MCGHRGALCVVGFLLLSLTACEGDPIGRTVPVKGKVTVNGKALTAGSVVYWPDEGKGNKSEFTPNGQIGADGSYELNTKGKPGAPPGAYKVTVNAQTVVDSTKPETAKPLVSDLYTTKAKTPLLKEVTENAAEGAYDLAVK
jgi:hypothetical protein